jgi:ATP-dependent Clp protease ATP-binding subunit ClpX
MPTMEQCAFCDRPRNEVKQLVESPANRGTFICDRCIRGTYEAINQGDVKAEGIEELEDLGPLDKPAQMYEHLNGYVISQEAAKKDVAVAVYDHYKRREALRKGLKLDVEIQKSNILILGPTGSGKTQLARAVAKRLKVPFYVADATKLTMAGYVGDDVESLIQGLLSDCEGDVMKAEWGIVFLDETDKLARKSGRNASGYRDVTGEGVQQALLKLIEGEKVQVPKGMARAGTTSEYNLVNTENILFICAGSFAGIEEIVTARINKSSKVGFGAPIRQHLETAESYSLVEEEDILEFGIIPEMLGRIPIRTSTLPLTEDEMVQVLTEPKDAIIKQAQALYRMDGIDLQFDEAALRAIGREAKSRPTGARALRSIIARILKKYSYECPSDPTVKTVRITEDVVERKGEAIIVREPVPAPQMATA